MMGEGTMRAETGYIKGAYTFSAMAIMAPLAAIYMKFLNLAVFQPSNPEFVKDIVTIGEFALVVAGVNVLFIVLGSVASVVPAYLVYLLSSLVFEGALPVLLAAMVALPTFILVMLTPWWCLGGLMEVFRSSAWTLTYRELRAVEDVQPERVPAADAASLDAAPAT